MSAISENGILDHEGVRALQGHFDPAQIHDAAIRRTRRCDLHWCLGRAGTGNDGFGSSDRLRCNERSSDRLGGSEHARRLSLLGVGLVCTLLSCKYMFENVTLDQDFNAKKIAAATTKAQGLGIAHSEPEQNKPVGIPGMAAHEQHADKASDAKWTKKVGGQRHHTEKHADAHEKKPHDASIPKPHVDSWASEVKQADQHAETARTVH
jgi:hypothetical protein